MHEPSWTSVRVTFPPLNREQVMARIRNALPDLARQLPVRQVVLFGSYARGRYTAYSDIDLLVIYDDPPMADAFQRVRRAIPLRALEPHVYSRSEAQRVATVLKRMTREGVVFLDLDGDGVLGPAPPEPTGSPTLAAPNPNAP